ncbi:MAG: WYL domain-containing protein [Ruminococcus sp.]|nr:WYL domain-containing protein [Ruminococcus sp.]
METKPRILYLQKILLERTDEEHPLSIKQLIDILKEEYQITAHRTTVVADITALINSGLDIITNKGSQFTYYVGSREFQLPELKLLIDAVESSKFITASKSKRLIEKIHGLASEGQVPKLKRNNFVDERVKPNNEQIYYIVDKINDAINMGRQISFQYNKYNRKKELVLKNDGEVYQISPYNLLWNDDFYYMLGFSERRNKIITFRVDRIAGVPKILPDDATPKPADFDIAEYTKEVFYMFDGNITTVKLRCANSLMKTMIDRFGEDVKTSIYDKDSFSLTTEVSASQTFFGWVFGFGGEVQILSPKSVKEQYKQMLLQTVRDIEEK